VADVSRHTEDQLSCEMASSPFSGRLQYRRYCGRLRESRLHRDKYLDRTGDLPIAAFDFASQTAASLVFVGVSRSDSQIGKRRKRGIMSKSINVNPGHYKVAGRGRQGENVVHEIEKREEQRLRGEERELPGPQRSKKAPTEGARNSVAASQRSEPMGISNRLSARAEAREFETHPPVDTSSPAPEDAAGRVGERPLEDRRHRHTSHKTGSRSIAQKEAAARYPDRSMPASRKVPGAFGREPQGRSTRSPMTRSFARRRKS
jgi:hypothetical protein